MSDSAEHTDDVAPVNPTPTEDASLASVVDMIRERGFITTGELFAAFPNLEPDTDELRRLYDAIESRGVKILDEIAEELQLEDQRRAGASTASTDVDDGARRRATEHRPSA